MAFVRTFHGYERTFSLALTRALSPSPPRPPRLVAVLRQAQPPGGAGRQRGARRPRGRAGRRAHKDVEAHNQAVPLRGRRAAVPPRRVGARAHWRRCPACRRGPPRVGGLRLSCRDRRAPTGAAPARPRARAPARPRAAARRHAACRRAGREATGPGLFGREGDGHDRRPAPRAPRCPRSCGRGLRRGLRRRTRSRTGSTFGRMCTRSSTTFYSTRCAPHPRARRAPRAAHRAPRVEKGKGTSNFELGPMRRYAAMRRPSRGQEAAVSPPLRGRRSENGKDGLIARTRTRRGAGVLQPAAPARGPALQGIAVWETRRQARQAR